MSASVAGAAFWATPGLAAVLAALNAEGEEARVVGGAVRNTLLGLPVTDVDIATTALPGVVVERARRAGLKPVPTGIEHGTVTVVAAHHAFEVTTLREDTETDGRRAVVRFGRSWQHDAERRDFTLNALYATPTGEVVDLVDGLPDLAARRIRFIGDADARIREDYLRILRLYRFHAAYGAGPVDRTAFTATVRRRAGLLSLSRERVRAELMKLLVAPGAAATLAVMSDAGLLQPLLAGIADVAALERMAVLEQAAGVRADAVRRLGALALRVPDDAERLRERLRLSNAEGRRLVGMSRALAGGRGWLGARPVGADGQRSAAEAAATGLLLAEPGGPGARMSVPAGTNVPIVPAGPNLPTPPAGAGGRGPGAPAGGDGPSFPLTAGAGLQAPAVAPAGGARVPALPLPGDARAARAFLYAEGIEAGMDLALLAAVHGWGEGAGGLETVARLAAAWTPPKPPFAAADLMALGLKPGRALGQALARAEAAWVAADFPDDPATIADLVAQAAVTAGAEG